MGGWINAIGEQQVTRERVESAIAVTEQQRVQAERLDREHRDLQTAFRLEMAIQKVPDYLL